MTREEAIAILNSEKLRADGNTDYTDEEVEEAVKMAIKAIKSIDAIKADISMYESDCRLSDSMAECAKCNDNVFGSIYRIIDRHTKGGERMTIDEAIKAYTNNAEYECTHGSLQGCLDFKQLTEWLTDYKRLKEQTTWIPVSERLPGDKNKDYLVCCADGYIATIMYAGFGRWLIDDEIVAWMPLPKAYEPQESDNCN